MKNNSRVKTWKIFLLSLVMSLSIFIIYQLTHDSVYLFALITWIAISIIVLFSYAISFFRNWKRRDK